MIACIFITEGAKLVQQMEDACWKKKRSRPSNFCARGKSSQIFIFNCKCQGRGRGEIEKKTVQGGCFPPRKKRKEDIYTKMKRTRWGGFSLGAGCKKKTISMVA